MSKSSIVLLIAFILCISAIVVLSRDWNSGTLPSSDLDNTPTVNQNISDGIINLAFSEKEFGLATNETQILVHSYIPPCDANFKYCLYYVGTTYQGTNFESAGIRIQNNINLKTESACLTVAPNGYEATTKPNNTISTDAYDASVFKNLGNAGAGHFADGSLYRLYVKNNQTCYEIETRIGQTQFANYPSGTIQLFTEADHAILKSKLETILNTLQLENGPTISLPR